MLLFIKMFQYLCCLWYFRLNLSYVNIGNEPSICIPFQPLVLFVKATGCEVVKLAVGGVDESVSLASKLLVMSRPLYGLENHLSCICFPKSPGVVAPLLDFQCGHWNYSPEK